MKTNNNQSAIQAIKIYQSALQKDRDVMVSGKGEIREVTLFDRFKEGLNSLNPDHKVRNWQDEARQHIKTMLVQDIQLFKPVLSAEEKTALDTMATKILDLSKPSSQYWSALLDIERANNPLLTDVLTNIKSMDEKVDSDIYRYVRPVLQNNHGDLDEAIDIAKLTLQLKKEKGLSTSVSMTAAKNINFAMKTFALDFKDAFDLVQFSGRLVHTGKISQSQESIENAYLIKFLSTHSNKSQKNALEQRSNVLAVMRRDNISFKEAVEVIARRIAVIPEINSGLPASMAISPNEEVVILSQQLPDEFEQQLCDDFQKLSLKKTVGAITSDMQFDLDVERMVIAFKPAIALPAKKTDLMLSSTTPDISFRSSQEVNADLKKFAADDPSLTGMLTRLLNQKALAGLAVNAWNSVPLANGAILKAPPYVEAEKKIRPQTTIFELSASGSDDIFLDCTYLQKSHLLFDANDKQWEVNRGAEWEGDVNDRNCGQRLKLRLKFSRNELKQGISNPQIVRVPTIEYFIKPAWDLIDAKLAAKSAS